jgi:hypothetical protein
MNCIRFVVLAAAFVVASASAQLVEANAMERISKMPGHVIETISPEEEARWKKQLEVISTDWIKATPNGSAVLAAFRDEIRKARAGQ